MIGLGHQPNHSPRRRGFTIVELLIVIVVIAILAAITIVAFNGIQNQARDAAAAAALSQAGKSLEAEKVKSGADTYPSSLTGLALPSDYTYSYQRYDTSAGAGRGYCLTATKNGVSTFTTSAGQITGTGSCEGLLAWWPMNGNALDNSGYGHNGVVNGATLTTGQNGKSESAYSFANGSSQQIQCGNEASLRPSSQITISTWIYPTAYSSSIHGIVNYGGGGYWLNLNTDGSPSFYITDSNVTTSEIIPLNQWTHLVGVYDGSTRTIYRNGEVLVSNAKTGPISNYAGLTCQIGSVKDVSDRYFRGSIDDVRIFDRALPAAEIQALYKVGAQ
ncbi:hypothetical protein CMN23_02935 [Candidatus Saccharibacteria bacterium]|nr:hypothetical protein [Candidatus Saccharibacteria bacterium]